MKKHLYLILFLLALHTAGWADNGINVVMGTVKLNGVDIAAEYTLTPNCALLGSGRNACIPQYSDGEVVVPATITVNGSAVPVEGVSDVAFRLCSHITSVELPEGVTRVGNFAFKGCRDLSRVTLPSTVTSVGTGAFINLPHLTEFFVKAVVPPVWEYNDVFFFHNGGIGDVKAYSIGNITLYVPQEKITDYQNALYSDENLGWKTPDGWGRFETIQPIEEFLKEPYAAYDSETRTLTLYNDGMKGRRSLTCSTFSLNDDSWEPDWHQIKDYVKKVVFTPAFSEVEPTTTSGWFKGFQSLTAIEGLDNLNTSEVTDMSEMFFGCLSLTSLNLSHFDTGNCTNLSRMFSMCTTLAGLDLSSFDTDNVTSMEEMFSGCRQLESLDLSHFKTEKVTSFKGMFSYCTSLTTLHVETFDTRANDGNGESMFKDCQSLTTITIPSSITSASEMLTGCTSMTDVYYYGLAPFKFWSDNKESTMLKPEKATLFHVLASKVDEWTTQYPQANCTFVGDLGTADSPLLLYTAEDWNDLAALVKQGVTGINAKMMADITCDKDVVVGTSAEKRFTGTFDGNGHTLTMNMPDDKDIQAAPFYHVGDATFKNLVVDGNICGAIYASGLVGSAVDGSTILIENCRVKAYIKARHNSSSGPHIGGFVGHGHSATISIMGCLFEGFLSTNSDSPDSYAGAFIGWCTSTDNKTVVDCFERGKYANLYRKVDMNFDEKGNSNTVSNTHSYKSHVWDWVVPHGYSVTCGIENYELDFGFPTKAYDVSGITTYATGMMVGDTYYAGRFDQVTFGFVNSGYAVKNVSAGHGITPVYDSRYGTYSFTMPAADCVITGELDLSIVTLKDDGTDNKEILRVALGQTTDVLLKDRVIYTDGGWNTLCLPFDVTAEVLGSSLPAGYELKTFDDASFAGGTLKLWFSDVNDAMTIEAGTPFLIRWAEALQENVSSPVFEDVVIAVATPGSVRKDLGGTAMNLILQGVFDRYDIDQENRSILYLGSDNTLYYPQAAMSVNACRALFWLTGLQVGEATEGNMGINSFQVCFDGEETGINAGTVRPARGSDTWYTLDGRKLSGKPTRKGVFIHDGRKAVVK